jgi:FkbM family methyltransferase
MNFGIVSFMKQMLKKLGIYDKVRGLYLKARFFRSKTRLQISGVQARFWTTNASLYSRVVEAGGEREQMEAFTKHIRKGDVVWDIGSFVGMYSILASRAVGAEGRVYAFEPTAQAYNMLKRNIRLNGADNLTVLNVALGKENGEGRIYSSQREDVAIHSLMPGPNKDPNGTPVSIWSGDRLVESGRAPRPNVIKIDVEGAEFLVLSGMRDALADSKCRFLLAEIHPQDIPAFGGTVEEVKALLTQSGFVISREMNRGNQIHFLCEKSA